MQNRFKVNAFCMNCNKEREIKLKVIIIDSEEKKIIGVCSKCGERLCRIMGR